MEESRLETLHHRNVELPKIQNAKHDYAQQEVIALGHIGRRWGKELSFFFLSKF
jgi:hypothetical protein